jgi:2,3,4,5-tetrahydropyridine-2-carboxylate N-succinyltransferase
VELVITKLDDGQVRVAEIGRRFDCRARMGAQGDPCCSFACAALRRAEAGPLEYLDRLELKRDYERRGVRVVPGAVGATGQLSEPRRHL